MTSFLFQMTDGVQADTADTLSELMMEESSISFLDILMQGGLLMIPIFICSVLAIYVIAERWRFLNQSTMEVDPFLSNIEDRKSTRLNSSHVAISYAVFC